MNVIIQSGYNNYYRSPKLSLDNIKGFSNENAGQLQQELEVMAANLVGEVCIHIQYIVRSRVFQGGLYVQCIVKSRVFEGVLYVCIN